MSGVVEESFKNAGKKEGTEIWRIKNFKAEPLAVEEYGSFYSGDSYIIMHTIGLGKHFSHRIHMLQGEDSSTDEQGTAAILTVQLDTYLGGGPVQYREVQDHESPQFLSLFRKGIRYMKGGHDSGFRHVGDPKWEPRLFQVKGKRNVRVRQVDLSCDSLNLGDVFILDKGRDIYVWMPPECGNQERMKGIAAATNIRDVERAGKAKIHMLDQEWDECPEFFDSLGGKAKSWKVKSAAAGGDDDEHVMKENAVLGLWRISDASGKITVVKVAEGKDLTMELLDSTDAFILDTPTSGIFVWVGKKCTKQERAKGMEWAQSYLKQAGKPSFTSVVRVLDGAEPDIFKQWFSGKSNYVNHLYICSDASGKLAIDEIISYRQKDLSSDDVMLLDVGPTIYVWIGAKANANEKKGAHAKAEEYLRKEQIPRPPGGAKIKTIEQGKEPEDFRRAFKTWDPNFHERTVEGAKKYAMSCPKMLLG